MRRLLAIVLVLGLFGVASVAHAQQGLSLSARPNFGARTVANGFGTFSVPVVSTGTLNVAGMGLAGTCVGYATTQPDFNFTIQGAAIPFVRVFVDGAGADTTLIVNRADGTWACNDDTYGTNPDVDLSNAAPGLYNVWVGAYSAGAQPHGTLVVTQNANAQPGGGGAAPPPAGGGLSVSAPPNFGARNIGNGFGTLTVPVVSTGTMNVAAMNLGANCLGYATTQPDFNFTVQGSAIPYLRIFVDAGSDDTTLVVNRADGSWACNDDTFGRNPDVDLTNAAPGLYNVWVGNYQAGVQAHGTLTVSQNPNAQPGGAVGVNTPPPPPPPPVGQLSTNARPNYGARTISDHFGGFLIPVVSSGTLPIATMNLGTGCTGFATSQPDFTFTIQGTPIPFIRIFVDAGADDTTLVVNRADGSWSCNDDTFGHDPKIDLMSAAPGVYNVWVGTYQSGVAARGTLSISQNPHAQPEATPAAGHTLSMSGTGPLNGSAPPTFGTRSIAPGISPDPIRINVTAGGDLDSSTLALAAGCTGWVSATPQYSLTLSAADPFLRIYADHFPRGANPSLLVRKPDGTWTCNDDSHGGPNPTIDVNNAAPGLYTVWLGNAQSGSPPHGRLNVTELPQNHP